MPSPEFEEDTIDDGVGDRPATLHSNGDVQNPETYCGRRLEHLTSNGSWKTCVNCRELVQQFSQELVGGS